MSGTASVSQTSMKAAPTVAQSLPFTVVTAQLPYTCTYGRPTSILKQYTFARGIRLTSAACDTTRVVSITTA